MFSKLTSISNPCPQSIRDAMSLAVADRSLLFDNPHSPCGCNSFESCMHHYSCDELANLSKVSAAPVSIPAREASPGAPAGDHYHHPSGGGGGKTKAVRGQKNSLRGSGSPRVITSAKNTSTTPYGSAEAVAQPAIGSPAGSGSTGRGRCAPNSAENAQRFKSSPSTVKPRTSSAKMTALGAVAVNGEERGNSSPARRHTSPLTARHNSTQSRNMSPQAKGQRNASWTGSKGQAIPASGKNLATRKSADGSMRVGEMSGQSVGNPVDGGVKALSSSELIVAKRSVKETQRQMRQKAKLAIAMWKERMTKKRESSAPRLVTCQGCFPPLLGIPTGNEDLLSMEINTDRSPSPRSSRSRQPIPRYDCQAQSPPETRQTSPRKSRDRESTDIDLQQQQHRQIQEMHHQQEQQQQRPLQSPKKRSKHQSTPGVIVTSSDLSPSPIARPPSEYLRPSTKSPRQHEVSSAFHAPPMQCSEQNHPQELLGTEMAESPIPRSSPDDLTSATDASTKAASSSQLSGQQQLMASGGTKRNSASSRETQRSKIPRPVDGQGDKVKKNDSAETTSLLQSSSSEKEEGTSQENLLALLPPDDSALRSEPPPPPLSTPSSPLVATKSINSMQSQPRAQDELSRPPQHQSHQQQQRTVGEILIRDKRRRRGGQRMLHSTDEEEDDWPDSPSTGGSPPIYASRAKPRSRHHPRRSPRAAASASPPSLMLLGKRTSAGDADAETVDGSIGLTGAASSNGVITNGRGNCSGPDSDTQSSAVIVPRRKPVLQRKLVEMKVGGVTSEVREHVLRKRQRQEIYALNQVMTALEFAQFEHFCRTRNIPLSV